MIIKPTRREIFKYSGAAAALTATASIAALLNGCAASKFDELVCSILNETPPPDLVDELYTKISQYGYIKDKKGKDYWKTPKETRISRRGDCMDFAILGFYTLWDEFPVRIGVGTDPCSRNDEDYYGWLEVQYKNNWYVVCKHKRFVLLENFPHKLITEYISDKDWLEDIILAKQHDIKKVPGKKYEILRTEVN